MKIITTGEERLHSHRFAYEIISAVPELSALWEQIKNCIETITDEDLKSRFSKINENKKTGRHKSLAAAINSLIDERLKVAKWVNQSDIFATTNVVGSMIESEYQDNLEESSESFRKDRKQTSVWTLDFSKSVTLKDGKKSGMAVEVAFNHASDAAWNLVKPVIASEINDARLKTNIGEGIGIVIVASKDLKFYGNFDNSIGDFTRYLKTLNAMRSQLTTPILLVPLAAPANFYIQRKSKKIGSDPEGTIKDY